MTDQELGMMMGGMTMIIITLLIYIIPMVISFGVMIFTYICYWKIYKKAGYQGWEAIVPFYCNYVQSEITIGKGIWFLLLFIPGAGAVIAYIMLFRLGKAFQKSDGFCIGLLLVPLVFLALIAFDKVNTYKKLEPLF